MYSFSQAPEVYQRDSGSTCRPPCYVTLGGVDAERLYIWVLLRISDPARTQGVPNRTSKLDAAVRS